MPPQTPLKTGAWDPEEDELLYHWQGKVGNKWSEIAKHIPGRTGQQCAQRWRHKVNPNIRRDKWTDEEDSHLVDLVKTFGIGKWAEIARHMVGRTDQQCMGRWRRHLDPSIRRDQWSAEEDARLRALYAQYGTSWSRISKALKGRTSQQCRARWHQLDSGRSRRSTGGPVANGVTGSSGQGSAAGGGPSDRASAKQRPRSRRFDDSSDSGDEYEDEGLTESEGGGDGGEREGYGGDAAALEGADQPMAPADEGEDEGRQQQQQQQPAGGPAPPLAPLGIAAASPRRPPRPHAAPGSGASTPGRRGGGMPGSPRIDIASPRLLSPLGSSPRGAGAIGYGAADEDPASAGWQQLAQSQGLDAQEAAGAETLLHIASVFRRGSGDLEPPGARAAGALRRSDFITDNTPTKRSPARRPGTRLSDDLSPSPFKKAHSLTGGGGSGEAVAGLGDFQSRLAAADADGDDQAGGEGAPAADVRSGGRRLTAKRGARRGEGSALPFRAADADRDDDMDDANAGPMDGHGGLAPVMFDLGTASAFPLLAAEPSPRRAASAPPPGGAGAAAGLLSPPAAARRGLGAGATPPGVRRASGAGAAVLNLLGSPKFEQLAGGCATPTNALAHVQPSPATLAVLQSPAGVQLEPLWTPYTGLAKESLLSGANAGKDASGRDLFSLPAAAGEAAAAPGAEDTSAAAATAPPEAPGAVSGGAEAAAGAEAGSSSHHRVVRRLDQHEAWGGTGSSDGAADGSPSPVGLAEAAGAGEASSPPKRARVPLFSDNGGMSKHEPADGAAPPIRSGGAGKAYEPSRLGPSSAVRGAAVSQARSPGRLASWRLPPASAMLRSPSGAVGERRRVPVLPAAMEVATVQQQQQQQQQPEPLQQQQQQQQPPPGTPVQARPIDGQHSTSATPTTPSFQAGCGAGSSPSDYATPQQRLRLAPPTAPLHRDCLIAAAASAAARLAAAGDGDAPSTVSSKAPRAGTAAAAMQAPPEGPSQLQPQLQVGESSPVSGAPPELVQAGAAAWDTGMMAMLRGLQRSPLGARSDDGGPEAGTSAPTPACGAGAPLATPCASARPAATPATVLASHLSSATPLALGGGLERATPVVLSTPATVLDFGTPAARAAVVAAATITSAASAGPGTRHSNGGDSTAAAASPKAAWVGVQLALAGKQPPHSQPTGLKAAAAAAAAPSSQAQGSAAVRSRLQALLEGL